MNVSDPQDNIRPDTIHLDNPYSKKRRRASFSRKEKVTFNMTTGVIVASMFGVVLYAFTIKHFEKTTGSRKLYKWDPAPVVVQSIEEDSGVGIAMLMGFPWCGQNFLQKAIHDMTQTSTAMNYGQAVMDLDGIIIQDTVDSVPIYKDRNHGPFAFSLHYPFPSTGHVLTRTYCAGHCTMCTPKEYIKTASSHMRECHSGIRFTVGSGNNITADNVMTETPVHFSATKVTKYIHLIRDPFTHIAARFEHERDHWEIEGKTDLLTLYPPNAEGFYAWCYKYDDNWRAGSNFQQEKQYYINEPKFEDLARSVPCHSDFFRLIQWHNNAFEIGKNELEGKPMKIIYYEDIVEDPVYIMDDLLSYLELERIQDSFTPLEEMVINGPYYYEEDIANITAYIQTLASMETWDFLETYF